MLEDDALVPIERVLHDPGAPAAAADDEREGGIDGEGVGAGGELRWERPEVGELAAARREARPEEEGEESEDDEAEGRPGMRIGRGHGSGWRMDRRRRSRWRVGVGVGVGDHMLDIERAREEVLKLRR